MPTATAQPDPSGTKGCSSFRDYEEAKRWYDAYYPQFGDVAQLDRDEDGIPCPGLPHTPNREKYLPKRPRPEFRLPLAQ